MHRGMSSLATMRTFILAMIVALAYGIGGSGALAQPATGASSGAGALESARSELAQAKAQMKTRQTELDRLAFAYATTEERLEALEDQVLTARADLGQARADEAQLQIRIKKRMKNMYMNDGRHELSLLGSLLTADAPVSTFINRLKGIRLILRQDSDLFAEVEKSVAKLAALETELLAKEQAKQNELEALARDKESGLQVLEASKDEYNALQAKIKRLEEEERRRVETARLAAEKAAQAASARGNGTVSGRSSGPGPAAGQRAVVPGASWVFPLQGPNSFINDWGFPRSGGRTHKGTDIMTPRNTPVAAVVSGVISKAQSSDRGLGGVTLWLRGEDGNSYYYAHLESIASGIAAGTAVNIGQVIGYAGDSGNARGGETHLHFEIHPGGGSAVNPYPTLIRYR